MIGTAIALGIAGMAASAGTQAIGAHMASSASKDAAKLQTQAADKAQGYYDNAKKTYDDVYSPYLNSGRTAASTLARLTTPGPGARYAAADPTQAPPQAAPPPNRAVPRALPPGRQMADGPGPGPRSLGGMVPQQQARPQQGPRMVMIEAPDGSGTRPVPMDQVDRFVQMGGRVVQ